jgi:hypothetical protein
VDGGGINPGFEELNDLLLYIGALLATTRHGGDVWLWQGTAGELSQVFSI